MLQLKIWTLPLSAIACKKKSSGNAAFRLCNLALKKSMSKMSIDVLSSFINFFSETTCWKISSIRWSASYTFPDILRSEFHKKSSELTFGLVFSNLLLTVQDVISYQFFQFHCKKWMFLLVCDLCWKLFFKSFWKYLYVLFWKQSRENYIWLILYFENSK